MLIQNTSSDPYSSALSSIEEGRIGSIASPWQQYPARNSSGTSEVHTIGVRTDPCIFLYMHYFRWEIWTETKEFAMQAGAGRQILA
jgi:hypothetical protein